MYGKFKSLTGRFLAQLHRSNFVLKIIFLVPKVSNWWIFQKRRFMKIIWHRISIETLYFKTCLPTRQDGFQNRDNVYGEGGEWIGVCKSADPCYFLARSVDPTLFSLKIQIRITELLLLRDFGFPKYSQQFRKFVVDTQHHLEIYIVTKESPQTNLISHSDIGLCSFYKRVHPPQKNPSAFSFLLCAR